MRSTTRWTPRTQRSRARRSAASPSASSRIRPREAETSTVAARVEREIFVGRADLVERIVGLFDPDRGSVADAVGIAGTGKSWLMRHVRRLACEPGNVADVQLWAEGESAPTTITQSYDAFVRELRALAEALAAGSDRGLRMKTEFETALKSIELATPLTINVEQHIDAAGATIIKATVGKIQITISGPELEEGMYAIKGRAAADAFVHHFRPLMKRRAAVVTFDDYDVVAGTPLARWLVDLLEQMPRTLVLVGRSPTASQPPAAGRMSAPLPPFSLDEVAEVLRTYLGGVEPEPRLVETINTWSEGHPFTVCVAAKALATAPANDVDAFLEYVRNIAHEEREETALQIISAPGIRDLSDLASSCSVLRTFDADIFAAVVDGGELAGTAAAAIERLEKAGIVERVGERADARFRLHSFVREPLEQSLEATDHGRRRRLHERAANYYYGLLCEDEEDLDESARPYDRWYRYEQPRWQAQLREWLYHQRRSATSPSEHRRARVRFARVFLDAFWWWSCYLERDFPFCADLIADWERARDDDSEWIEDLRLLLTAYPRGWQKQGKDGWDEVTAALIGIREQCGLDGDASELRGLLDRHTRGLIDNFLAHTYRYRSFSSPAEREWQYRRAVGYYEEAATLFERGKETWELAWTLFESAELHADNEQWALAREVWHRAAPIAVDEEDHELIANLHRLCADIRWGERRAPEAFDAHGLAVLHAYLFQRKTPSMRPDAYTVEFYWEQIARTWNRLLEVEPKTRDDAVARARQAFGLERASAATQSASDGFQILAGTVFPRAPRDDELLEGRSELTRAVDLLAEKLGPAVDADLKGIEP